MWDAVREEATSLMRVKQEQQELAEVHAEGQADGPNSGERSASGEDGELCATPASLRHTPRALPSSSSSLVLVQALSPPLSSLSRSADLWCLPEDEWPPGGNPRWHTHGAVAGGSAASSPSVPSSLGGAPAAPAPGPASGLPGSPSRSGGRLEAEETAMLGGSARCRTIDGVSTWFQEEGPSGPRDCIPDEVARNLDFVLVLGGGLCAAL